jgi:LmbE family N-acetylglucosaminyl deacetylase
MMHLPFAFEPGRAPSILALGAHCDDIEIGCGGTLLALRRSLPEAEIRWIIFSGNDVRRRETLESARLLFGADALPSIRIESFRDGYLPYEAAAVKDAFEQIKRECSPDLIFTHFRHDLHQDHRLVSELTWNTWRNHLILEYEIPKYDGDLGQPNTFFPLTAEQVDRKVGAILQAHASQAEKQWLDAETLRGLLRLRGMEANAPERYAEAFYGRKLVLRSA